MSNVLKTATLFAFLIAVFVAIGYLVGGTDGMLVAFVLACVLNFGAYWFSGSIALRMARTHEVTSDQAPELYAVVQELALK